MINESKDEGVIAVLLERLSSQRLPRALALKKRVDRGEVLTEPDIAFLERCSRMRTMPRRSWTGIRSSMSWQVVLSAFTKKSPTRRWRTRRIRNSCHDPRSG